MMRMVVVVLLLVLMMSACTLEVEETPSPTQTTGGSDSGSGETGRVIRVIDGDTIDVDINGQSYRVRYIGINTPEDDEVCYDEASTANSNLVSGQTVRLERDVSNTDRFDRLLRYVYVGEVFVNAELVRTGYAEVVRYPPDSREFENFRSLEQAAERAGLGCHLSGIFDDDDYDR